MGIALARSPIGKGSAKTYPEISAPPPYPATPLMGNDQFEKGGNTTEYLFQKGISSPGVKRVSGVSSRRESEPENPVRSPSLKCVPWYALKAVIHTIADLGCAGLMPASSSLRV